jgi:hypothetical protein
MLTYAHLCSRMRSAGSLGGSAKEDIALVPRMLGAAARSLGDSERLLAAYELGAWVVGQARSMLLVPSLLDS